MIKLKHNTSQSILFLILVLSFFSYNKLNNIKTKPINSHTNDEKPITIDPDIIRVLSFGSPKLISSYLWTLTLLQSDIEHTKNERSWMFYRFHSISKLDPYFYENYLYGGLYLSIIKDDLRGAEEHYKRGLSFFPDSHDLLWNAGFNLCFELGECNTALAYFNRLLDLDKGRRFKLLPQIIAKIIALENNDKLAFDVLYTSYIQMPEGNIKNKIHQTLYALKARIDLSCLNSNKNDCQKIDFDGNLYNFKAGKYHSKIENIDRVIRLRNKNKK